MNFVSLKAMNAFLQNDRQGNMSTARFISLKSDGGNLRSENPVNLSTVEIANHDRFLRLPEVMQRVGLSKQSIYARMKAGSFPRPIKDGSRISLWLESDITRQISMMYARGKN